MTMKKSKMVEFAVMALLVVCAIVVTACASVSQRSNAMHVPTQFWTAMEAFEYEGMQYVNHQNGYVIYKGGTIRGTNVEGGRVVKIVASKNFHQLRRLESFMGFTGGFANRLTVNYWVIRDPAPGTTVAGVEAEKLGRAFRDKYAELAGYVGYRGTISERGRFTEGEQFNTGIWLDRAIEEIGDSIWLPMAWGDSTSNGGNDLARLNRDSDFPIDSFAGVSFLLYNRQQEKVYIVKDRFADIWQPSWGDPLNDIGDHTFTVNGASITQNSQLFLNGYAYMNGSRPVWVGARYTNTDGVHTYQKHLQRS